MARPRRLPKVLTPAEQRALLVQFNRRYASSLRNLLAVRLMLECGLRCGEVVAVRPEHIDLDTCRLLVREGKGGKDRVVWFSDDLRDLLVRWMERRPASEWLLPTRHGTQANTRYLRELVKRKALAAGVSEADWVTPHTLRHTFAADLFRRERNILLVQRALGHSSVMTTQIYTHLSDFEVERAMRQGRPVVRRRHEDALAWSLRLRDLLQAGIDWHRARIPMRVRLGHWIHGGVSVYAMSVDFEQNRSPTGPVNRPPPRFRPSRQSHLSPRFSPCTPKRSG
jgi:integrase/recombinase XerD